MAVAEWGMAKPAAIAVQEPSHALRSGWASKMVLLAWQGLVGLAKRAVGRGLSSAVGRFRASLRAVLADCGIWGGSKNNRTRASSS